MTTDRRNFIKIAGVTGTGMITTGMIAARKKNKTNIPLDISMSKGGNTGVRIL